MEFYRKCDFISHLDFLVGNFRCRIAARFMVGIVDGESCMYALVIFVLYAWLLGSNSKSKDILTAKCNLKKWCYGRERKLSI